jgi:hypothetical protein
MNRFPKGTGSHPMDDDSLARRCEVLAAERDAFKQSNAELVAMIERWGGFMWPKEQEQLRNAKALHEEGTR